MLAVVKQSYPTFSECSLAFSSSIQSVLLSDLEKAYSEKSPIVSDLERMYGDGASALWIKTQLLTLDFTSSTKDGADMSALLEFSQLFARMYHHVKLTEFLLFIARFKLGQYGKFYGYFDVITIGEAFKRFMKERDYEMDSIARKINNRRLDEKKEVERNHVPPDDLRAKLNKCR